MSQNLTFQIMPPSVVLPEKLFIESLTAVDLGLQESDIEVTRPPISKPYGEVWIEINPPRDDQTWTEEKVQLLLEPIFLFIKENRTDKEITVLEVRMDDFEWCFDLGRQFKPVPAHKRQRKPQMGFPSGGPNRFDDDE